MSTEANNAIIRRYFDEIRNQGNYDLVDELFDPSYQMNRPGLPSGIAGFRAMDAATRTAFPDCRWTIEDQIAEGNKVMTRFTIHGTHLGIWRSVPPTGRTAAIGGITVHRLVDGRIAERYGVTDDLDVLRQLGVTEVPSTTSG